MQKLSQNQSFKLNSFLTNSELVMFSSILHITFCLHTHSKQNKNSLKKKLFVVQHVPALTCMLICT